MRVTTNLLQAIKSAVAERSPEAVENLNPPATSEALLQLTTCFPDAPKDLLDLLAWHDGEGGASNMLGLLPNYMELLSIERILEVHGWNAESDMEPVEDLALFSSFDARAKPVFSSTRRIPFACCNGDVYWCIDLDPAPNGHLGQILHEDAECFILKVIAGSLPELLQNYLADLHAGQFSIEEDGQIVSLDDWPLVSP